MSLTSDALRGLDDQLWREWDWRRTTILYVSYDWDPINGGAEAMAGRRLVMRLLEEGARVHVLTAGGPDRELECSNYQVTVVPAPLPPGALAGALQLVRCGIPSCLGLWVRKAVTAGVRVLRSLPADTVIYGRAMPISSNIAAWYLARLTGRAWVAHFSDEWPPVRMLSKPRTWLGSYRWPLFRLWRRRILDERRRANLYESR